MRSETDRRVVAHLAAGGGLNASQIAAIAAIPHSTVREWLRKPPRPRTDFDPARLPEREYSYLLGFYLGRRGDCDASEGRLPAAHRDRCSISAGDRRMRGGDPQRDAEQSSARPEAALSRGGYRVLLEDLAASVSAARPGPQAPTADRA